MKILKQIPYMDLLIVLAGIGIAVALRYSMLDFKSVDFLKFTKDWYNTLRSGGFTAFRQSFSNYNVPYLYLLYLVIRLLPNLPGVIATKIPSLLMDFAMAWLAYRIVRLQYCHSPFPMFAAFAVLFAPTVALNSAFWGQADVLYTAPLVACLYFILIGHDLWAMIAFGVSVAFKAQAVFLLPFLLALVPRRAVRWWTFVFVPAVMILALIPAWIAGRSLYSLLMIYPAQAGQYEQLSLHAPSAWSWIPDTGKFYSYFYPVGMATALATALAYWVLIFRSRAKLTPSLLIELATISVMLIPFVLPKMHERYFFPADVFTILLAFYIPRLFFIPVGMSLISFFSYQPILFGVEPVPIPLLAFGVLILLMILVRDAMLQLYGATTPAPEAVELGA